jgi:hypothetical protein
MPKEKRIKPRLPEEAIITLRHRGGAQTTKKGNKGYTRSKAKQEQIKTKEEEMQWDG